MVSQLPTLLCYGLAAVFSTSVMAGESSFTMGFKLYVGNLSKSTTEEELNALFAQAGVVRAVDLYKDRKTGESNGFAFITMNAQSEADKALSMFNTYFLSDHNLKVNLIQSREKSRTTSPAVEP